MKQRSINQLFRNVKERTKLRNFQVIPPLVQYSSTQEKQKKQETQINEHHSHESQLFSDQQIPHHNTHQQTLKQLSFENHDHIVEQEQSHQKASTSRIFDQTDNYMPFSHQSSSIVSSPLEKSQNSNQPAIKIVDEELQKRVEVLNFQQLNDFSKMAFQKYVQNIEEGIEQPFIFQQPAAQIIKPLLTNAGKLHLYLQHVQQKQYQIRRQQLQCVELEKNKKQKHQKQVKNLSILSCLLAKITQSSTTDVQLIPKVRLGNSKDQIEIDFQCLDNATVHHQNRIKNLQKQVQNKQHLLLSVKLQYDAIIENYANTIIILMKKSQSEEKIKTQNEFSDQMSEQNIAEETSKGKHLRWHNSDCSSQKNNERWSSQSFKKK